MKINQLSPSFGAMCCHSWTMRSVVLCAAVSVLIRWGQAQAATAAMSDDPAVRLLPFSDEHAVQVKGTVLNGNRQPVAGARVRIIAEPYEALSFFPKLVTQQLGSTITASDGGFSLSVPSVPTGTFAKRKVLVSAEGFGISVVDLDARPKYEGISIVLRPEQTIRGTVTTPDGKPADGVELRVMRITEARSDAQSRFSVTAAHSPQKKEYAILSATTDAHGDFVLRGFPSLPQETHVASVAKPNPTASAGPMLELEVQVDDPRFAPVERVNLFGGGRETEGLFVVPGDGTKKIYIQLAETRTVEGTVIRKDTKRSMANAWVGAAFNDLGFTGDVQPLARWAKTDADGFFRISGAKGKHLSIYVFPPDGEPYPAWVTESKPWPAGLKRQEIAIEVPRGLMLHGIVVDRDSKQPVPGAAVEYQVNRERRKRLDRGTAHAIYWAAEFRKHVTNKDGRFQIAIAAELGSLMVKAPTPDFVSHIRQWGHFQLNAPGGVWYSLEGYSVVDPQPDQPRIDVSIPLTPGVTCSGTTAGPQETRTGNVMIFRRVPQYSISNMAGMQVWPSISSNGSFELRGCDPDDPEPFYFLDADNQWGTTVVFDPRQKAARQSVTLVPCGAARVTFVDQDGKPWARVPVNTGPVNASMWLVFVEGKFNAKLPNHDHTHVRYPMGNVDWKRYSPATLVTDDQGTITFPTLIPGAPHRLFVRNPDAGIGKSDAAPYQEISVDVKAGQTVDLGNVVIRRH